MLNATRRAVLVVLLSVLGASSLWAAQTATLTWTNSLDADVAGAKVYRQLSPCPLAPNTPMLQNVGIASTFTDNTIPDGIATVCYGVTDYDTSGNESGLSNQVSKTFVVLAAPGTPVLTVTVTDVSATVTYAPVSDGAGGIASVDVRFAPNPINWGAAPSASCTSSPCVIPGLTQKTSYDFQAVAYRGVLGSATFGPISAPVTKTTLATDTTPPLPPSNLKVSQLNIDQVQVAGLKCKSLKTTGSGMNRVVTCLH